MSISERKQEILKAVIDDYIEHAEPVGSKTIAQKSELKISSATVRNEMAELEDMGYLIQPHTSAGRIPTPKGYRLYVDELMRRHSLSLEETERINDAMSRKIVELDHLLGEAARLIAQITNYPTYSLTNVSSGITIARFDLIYIDERSFIAVLMTDKNTVRNKLFRVPHNADENILRLLGQALTKTFSGLSQSQYTSERISQAVTASQTLGAVVSMVLSYALEIMGETDRAEVVISGTSHLLEQPEYQDIDKAHRLLNYLSEEKELAQLPAPDDIGSMKILIGPENVARELNDASVVVASYDIGDNMKGLIGVVGPTRMDYAKISAKLSYFAENIGKIMKRDPTERFRLEHSQNDNDPGG